MGKESGTKKICENLWKKERVVHAYNQKEKDV